ncbi:MAG: hypothetical protein R3F59_31610 [Myxococcota bacterium]
MPFALLLAVPALAQDYTNPTRSEPAQCTATTRGGGGTVRSLRTLTASGDRNYDTYRVGVADAADSLVLVGGGGIPQLTEGLAGIFAPGGAEIGRVVTFKDACNPGHFLEQWFFETSIDAWAPGSGFTLEYKKMTYQVNESDLLGSFASSEWLAMDIVYQPIASLDEVLPLFDDLDLGYANGPAPQTNILEGYAFKLMQAGADRGRLLREQHDDGMWVDYWLFRKGYASLEAAGDQVELVPLLTAPQSAEAFLQGLTDQTSFKRFAIVTYEPKSGCDYVEAEDGGEFDSFYLGADECPPFGVVTP